MGSQPGQQPDWTEFTALRRNTVPPHANVVFYNTTEDALSRNVTMSKTQCLPGQWKSCLEGNPFEAPSDFEANLSTAQARDTSL